MSTVRRWLRSCALVAGLGVAAGCAPSFAPSIGVGVGAGPSLQIQNTSCLLTGSSMPEAGYLRFSSGAQVFGVMNQINAIRAKFSLAAGDPAMQMEGWKRLAKGGC